MNKFCLQKKKKKKKKKKDLSGALLSIEALDLWLSTKGLAKTDWTARMHRLIRVRSKVPDKIFMLFFFSAKNY